MTCQTILVRCVCGRHTADLQAFPLAWVEKYNCGKRTYFIYIILSLKIPCQRFQQTQSEHNLSWTGQTVVGLENFLIRPLLGRGGLILAMVTQQLRGSSTTLPGLVRIVENHSWVSAALVKAPIPTTLIDFRRKFKKLPLSEIGIPENPLGLVWWTPGRRPRTWWSRFGRKRDTNRKRAQINRNQRKGFVTHFWLSSRLQGKLFGHFPTVPSFGKPRLH